MIDSAKTKNIKPPRSSRYDQSFYPHLVGYLNPIFKVPEEECSLLNSASLAYFQALIIVDGIIDEEKDPHEFMVVISKIESAIKALSSIFEYQHPFWADFQRNKEIYFSTLKEEKQYSSTKKRLSEEDFDKIAIGKSYVCYSVLDALSYLSANTITNDDLFILLKEIHVAFQCKDDIDDFLTDLNQGQHTYAHELTLAEIRKASKKQEKIPPDLMHRYFYVSGLAEKILLKGISHFKEARQIALSYGLNDLLTFLDQEVENCHAQIKEINLLIKKTREKTAQSDRFLAVNGKLSDNLSRSIANAIGYIKSKISKDNMLSDFMTSAGAGENWITSYVQFLLVDHKQASPICNLLGQSELFCDLNKNQGTYNERIPSDADSLAFLIGATIKKRGKVPGTLIQAWLDHQNSQGGWRTYIEESRLRKQLNLDADTSMCGWTSPHLCVSSSTCYILSLKEEWEDFYLKTVDFLQKNLSKEGRLDSYWWTSSIYSTAWFIMAIHNRPEFQHLLKKTGSWLIETQSGAGSWIDGFSQNPNPFYTALALKALIRANAKEYNSAIHRAANYLLQNQYSDGSWPSNRKLAIPSPDSLSQKSVHRWRSSSFGVNILVDDHQRIFTTSTVLSTLLEYEKSI